MLTSQECESQAEFVFGLTVVVAVLVIVIIFVLNWRPSQDASGLASIRILFQFIQV